MCGERSLGSRGVAGPPLATSPLHLHRSLEARSQAVVGSERRRDVGEMFRDFSVRWVAASRPGDEV